MTIHIDHLFIQMSSEINIIMQELNTHLMMDT